MEKPKILIVDDNHELRSQMMWALNSYYDVLLAEDRPSAVQMVKDKKPTAVTLDLGLPPSAGDTTEGFLALADMLQIDPFLKVLVVTGQGEKQNGIEAIGQGAYDFFCKPVSIDELKVVLDRAILVQDLERGRFEQLENDSPLRSFEEILGTSPQIQTVFSTIQKVSRTDASVLIVGE